MVVQEALLRRESANGNDALQEFPKVSKDRTPRVRLHASQVPSRVQVSNREFGVDIADDDGWEYEQWKYNTVGQREACD